MKEFVSPGAAPYPRCDLRSPSGAQSDEGVVVKNGSDALIPLNDAIRFCDCPETLLRGRRIPCLPQHSCNYCRERSALVKKAERIALERVQQQQLEEEDTTSRHSRFTKLFAIEMERLSVPLLKNGQNA